MKEEIYKGWTISVSNKAYKIIGFEPDGKAHVLYSHVGTSTKNKKRDEYGNQLFSPYESDEQAFQKAKNYIDNFEDRLKQYLQNRTEKRRLRKLN